MCEPKERWQKKRLLIMSKRGNKFGLSTEKLYTIHGVGNCVCKTPETEHIHGIIRVCIKCGKKA